MFKALRTFLCAVAAVCFLLPASAQTSTANVFGTITDATGAAIGKATVTITQTDTNATRTVVSKRDGTYRADFLPIGPYTIQVSAPGFKMLDRTGIVLTVGQEADLSLALQVGGTGETVEVTSDVPLVNLGNSTIGRTVSNVEVDNLPLVNRDTYQLLNLTPGVQNGNALSSSGGQVQNTLGFQELHVYVNGSTDDLTGQVAYYLDGGLNMTGIRNSGNQIPNPDAIQEFNVMTNNFSAQLGRFSAAVVSVVTKSGTNGFHGSLFEFYRSKNFNATPHNSNLKLPYTRHQFGGTAGGPIRRDKDFFFVSAGALRFNSGATYTGSTPSIAQRAGNFSENLPVSITACTQSPSAADVASLKFLVCNPDTHTPYAGNVIVATAARPVPLDPTVQAILNHKDASGNYDLVPLPNPSQPTDTVYTHREVAPVPENNSEYFGKWDHVMSKHRVTVDYFLYNHDIRAVPTTLTQRWSYAFYQTKQQNANINDTWTLSPNAVNQLYLSYTRQKGGRTNFPASTISDFGSDFGVLGIPARPQFTVNSWFTLGQAISGPKAGANLYVLRDNLSISKGHHTFYMGGEAGLEKDAQSSTLNNYGTFGFSTTANARSNQSISDFILGVPTSMNQDTPVYAEANYKNVGLFAQDDWRIRNNLTLNFGVRYDIQFAPTDTQNRQTNFTPGAQSTAFNKVTISNVAAPAVPVGLLYPGDPGVPKTGANTPYNHVSPRAGFAWDAFGNGKTVFHAGAGLFFGGISGNLWELPSNSAPFSVRAAFSKVVSVTHPYSTDLSEFPTGTNPFPTFNYLPGTGSAAFIRPISVIAFDPNYKWPYNYQFNAGFQQQFGKSFVFGANFIASLNRKLPLYQDINPPTFNITAANASGAACVNLAQNCGYANTSATVNNRRPLNQSFGVAANAPLYSNVYIIRSNQSSNYNGLQLNFQQRITHNISFQGFYVWSKTLASNALDNSSLTGTFLDQNYPKLEIRQRSDVDVRHQVVASAVWKPAYFTDRKPILRAVLNGWSVSTIVTLQSGRPFTVTTGTDVNGDGQTNDRPNIAPGQFAGLVNNGGSRTSMMKQWFNTAAYCVPNTTNCQGTGPLGLLGLTRPAELSGPGYRDIDASIFRDFKIYETLRLQLRGEATNAFNLTNLGQPTAVMNSAQFGQVNGTTGNNRIIQVGGRLLF